MTASPQSPFRLEPRPFIDISERHRSPDFLQVSGDMRHGLVEEDGPVGLFGERGEILTEIEFDQFDSNCLQLVDRFAECLLDVGVYKVEELSRRESEPYPL